MIYDIIVQGIGFIAIAMNIISVQFNTHWLIMFFKSLGSFLFALQYLLLGAFTGMAMDLIGVVRNFIFAHNVKKGKSNKWWIVLFCIITTGVGITTFILSWSATLTALSRWSNNHTVLTVLAVILSLISIIAKVVSTIGYGFKSAHAIRMINLPTFSMWIVYNFVFMAFAGMLSDAMSIASIIIAEIRYKKKDKNIEQPTNE